MSSRGHELNSSEARAKSMWLLSFGDVVTLMITFFILLIAVNKGEITKIQKWSDEQLEHNYQLLSQALKDEQSLISAKVSLEGIKLILHADQSFAKGDYRPLPQLNASLTQLAQNLKQLPLFNIQKHPELAKVIQTIEAQGYQWILEVDVAGHTDNDPVNPRSPVRNNWILSALRAQTVASILAKESGLPHNIFIASGYADTRPLVPNDTPEHKAMNRRVEITILAYFLKKQ